MNTDERDQQIKYMEEISLNAWPSYRIELYDGWLLRYSHNYTYRTNSVEQIGESTIALDEKIAYCEEVYSSLYSPTSFKIHPLMDPSFDMLLEEKGYQVRHTTQVMCADLQDVCLLTPDATEYLFENRYHIPTLVHYDRDITVALRPDVTDEWLMGLFSLNGTSDPTLRRIVPKMYAAIPKQTIVASIELDGCIVATGLAIRDREWVGIYAIYVSPSCWQRGYARAICSTLLWQARELGAEKAYLQVVKGNARGEKLYESLGFSDFYTYWFRSLDYPSALRL